MASQMAPEKYSTKVISFVCNNYIFKATSNDVIFDGFRKLDKETEVKKDVDNENINLVKGEVLVLQKMIPTQHFTEPPLRYTEASLVDFMERNGIGRPSTYSQIIMTIISRGYVKRDGKSLAPTELGVITNDIMIHSFPDIVDYKFTAKMEDELDKIENGNASMSEVLKEFYDPFETELQTAIKSANDNNIIKHDETTDVICDKCGSKMVIKHGRNGDFLACPNYPKCKNTKSLDALDNDPNKEKEDEIAPFKCEKCGSDMILKTGRYGQFYACIRYPECKFTKQKLRKTTNIN